mgnify:CR=1 FL=1
MIHKNVITDFSPEEYTPQIDPSAHVHPLGAVIGNVILGKNVYVAPFASVRGDEGMPLHIGDNSNVQDGVIIHALETCEVKEDGSIINIDKNTVEVSGKKYAVYVGEKVSLAHQVQIHGPASVGNESFIGMKSLVFKAAVGNNCVIEPGCILMGVTVPDGRYVPAGTTLNNQKDADSLPEITDDYPLKSLNSGVVHVNINLAKGYNAAGLK